MAFTFDPSVGEATSNSYGDVPAADDYFAGRLNVTAWPPTSIGGDLLVKQKALVMMTTRIDQEEYKGSKTFEDQRLKFPRYDLYDEAGDPIADDEIPLQVEQATYEGALWLLQSGTSDPTGATGLELFKSIKAGPVELEMWERKMTDDLASSGLPPNVIRLLKPFIISYETPVAQFGTRRIRRS